MAQIHVLADDLINKIAAGEVIERPASVVKELVENAVDAGSRRITIEVESGGKKLVRVTDDGCGMNRDDALLAVERHATSKLRSVEDLLSIGTLGFRGEALPSIASVSSFALESRPEGEATGTRVEIESGRMQAVKDVGCPPGTQISVSRLFSRVPARRKFLRTDTTELGHIASIATHYALAHPEIHFTLKSGQHTILDAPPVQTLQERVYQVLGREAVREYMDLGRAEAGFPAYRAESWFSQEPVEAVSPGRIAAQGFVSRPEVQRSSAKSIFIFINRRYVRDRILINAIREAYRHVLPSGAYPSVLLYLELPLGEVDVNVHPQKTEVRFRHQSFVYDFVQQALRAGLSAGRGVEPGGAAEAVQEISVPPRPKFTGTWEGQPAGHGTSAPARSYALTPETVPAGERRLPFEPAPAPGSPAARVAEEHLPLRENLTTLRPLGQLNNSFIVAVNDAGLWLVDQHVAHERVLFEQRARERKRKPLEGQRLLSPVLVDLTPNQLALWDRVGAELASNGFEIDAMGERTLAVKAAPAGIATGDIEKLLSEILENVEREARQLSLEALQEKVAASVACHAAIKVNMPLTDAKMQWLLGELARTENPNTCPHGRPIVLRYPLRDILRSFRRI